MTLTSYININGQFFSRVNKRCITDIEKAFFKVEILECLCCQNWFQFKDNTTMICLVAVPALSEQIQASLSKVMERELSLPNISLPCTDIVPRIQLEL